MTDFEAAATDLLELSLAHTVGTAVERAYARDDALEQRRVIMVAWAEFMSKPDKAVQTPAARPVDGLPPAATSTASVRPETATGVEEVSNSDPSPSSPLSLRPQQTTSPETRRRRRPRRPSIPPKRS